MEGSQVNSVRMEGSAAFVSATFREAVVAHRGAAEPVQAFRWADWLVVAAVDLVCWLAAAQPCASEPVVENWLGG